MTRQLIKEVVREALCSSGGAHAAADLRRGPRDQYGTRGIGSVLRVLHDPVLAEPLPTDLRALLGMLDAVERKRGA